MLQLCLEGLASVLRDPRDILRVNVVEDVHALGPPGAVAKVALESGAGVDQSTVGLYHLAWEVDTLAELALLRDALAAAGSLGGASDHGSTKALYARDPDGIELEVSWLVPADLLDGDPHENPTIAPLDLDAELARYGADTPGGTGVSHQVV